MQGTGGQRGWQWSSSGAMIEAPASGSGEAEGGLKTALAGESVWVVPLSEVFPAHLQGSKGSWSSESLTFWGHSRCQWEKASPY